LYRGYLLPERVFREATMWWNNYLARWEAVHAQANARRVHVPRGFVPGGGLNGRRNSPRPRT
jgi:hypothetical protein